MNGFENPKAMSNFEEAISVDIPKISTMPLDEIERCVARGRQLRAAHLSEWGRRIALTWASVFRRPGRIMPPTMTVGRHAH